MKTLALVALVLGACLAAHRLANPPPSTAAEAIAQADPRALRGFLARGTPVETCDARGESLLAVAVTMRDRELATLLLDHGADPNRVDPLGNTPLHLAAMLGDLPMVRLLVSRGPDVNRGTRAGVTPQRLAAQAAAPELIRWLEPRCDAGLQLKLSGSCDAGDEDLLSVRAAGTGVVKPLVNARTTNRDRNTPEPWFP